jgi:hypothetical protein
MKTMHRTALFLLLGAMLGLPTLAMAQDNDDTGTNPINFTNDFRIYTDAQSLPGDVGNSLVQTTFEYRAPILDGKWQIRTKIPVVGISPESGSSKFGLGDIPIRFLTVPYVSQKYGFAVGMETFLDSATNDALGSGKHVLAPVVFFVAFNPGGLKGTLFAPGYQHLWDVAGDSGRDHVHRTQIDLFVLWLAENKKNWILVDPVIVLDYQNDKDTFLMEVEVGQMMFGGASSYIRPGFHVAGDELYDWNIELGLKFIWR